MAYNSTAKLVQEAQAILNLLAKIGRPLAGGVSAQTVSAGISALESTAADLEKAKEEVIRLVNRKDDAAKSLNDLIVKARVSVKAEFGDDSDEYELAGGTRKSERKRPVRKPKAKA